MSSLVCNGVLCHDYTHVSVGDFDWCDSLIDLLVTKRVPSNNPKVSEHRVAVNVAHLNLSDQVRRSVSRSHAVP